MKNPFWRLVTRREGFIFFKNTFVLKHKDGESIQVTVECRDPKLVAHVADSIKASFDPAKKPKAAESARYSRYEVESIWQKFNDFLNKERRL